MYFVNLTNNQIFTPDSDKAFTIAQDHKNPISAVFKLKLKKNKYILFLTKNHTNIDLRIVCVYIL